MNNIVPVELVNKTVRHLKYQVLVDLDNNGVFETDISDDANIDYVQLDLEIKNPGESIGKPSTSSASISLNNESTRYSPDSPKFIEKEHSGWTFRRNTKIRILAGFVDDKGEAQTQEVFQGVITGFKYTVKNDTNMVVLTLKDLAKFAQNKKNPNHTYVNGKYYEGVLFDVTISEAASYLIDFCYGESFQRDIDNLYVKYACIEFDSDSTVWATLQKLAEACGAKMYFEGGVFKFYSPMVSNHYSPDISQYTFVGDNIFDLTQTIDEDNIVNKWIIESDGKTLQSRQVIVGTPSENTSSTVDYYKSNDGKNAVSGRVITLKSQDPDTNLWVDSMNVPLVDTTTYSDLTIPNPTKDDIDEMNGNSLIKVWDLNTNTQLTIYDVDCKTGKITLLNNVSTPYNLQVSYQYYTNQIVSGKYKLYEYSFDNVSRNIEFPDIEANDGYDFVNYSTENPNNTLYLSNWEILDGSQRVKFRLHNNVPSRSFLGETLDTVTISKMEIYGNPLQCVSHLKVVAEDTTLLAEFEKSYSVTNNYIIDSDWGQKLADYYLSRNKLDKSYIDITTNGIPQLQLMDRVTLVESITGISSDFVVIAIKHNPRIDGWQTMVSLEALQPVWVYDSSHTTTTCPIYQNGSMLVLPKIDILSNDAIEDDFANDAVSHSVVLTFTRPSTLNITNFLEGKVLYQVYDQTTTSLGRYMTVGSFNDSCTNQYKVNGLLPDKQYKFFIIISNKYNQQSPYGDGYTLNTPTTEELMTKYGPIAAPSSVQLLKGVSNTVTASVTSSSAPHYKSTKFQMVKIELPFDDASRLESTNKITSNTFTFPDETNYKVRACFIDIWNRAGSWSPESNISGGKISDSDVQSSFLEVKVSSDISPVSGNLNNLIDGTESSVVFDKPAIISYKYPYTNIFNIIRIRVGTDTNAYVQAKNIDTGEWENIVGNSTVPAILKANTLGNDANVFYFTENGDLNGDKKKKCVREVRIVFTSPATIQDIKIDTFGYFDELVVEDASIKSAMIDTIDASKIVSGEDPFSLPTIIDSINDSLFNFNNSISSTQGEIPVENNNITYDTGKFGNGIVLDQNSYLTYGSKIAQESTISFWFKSSQINNGMVLFSQGDSSNAIMLVNNTKNE